MAKPEGMIYPAVTAFFVFSALAQTLFMPIMGGISGFAILFLLFVKFVIGKMKEKVTASISNNPDETGGGISVGGAGMGKGNIYALIIEYITTPMVKFEKGMLLLGWVLWPILFLLVPMIIFVAIKDNCTFIGTDWCNILNSMNIL